MEAMKSLFLPEDYQYYQYQENHPLQLIFDALYPLQKIENLEVMTPHITAAMYHMQKVKLNHLSISPSRIESLRYAKCMSIYESNNFDVAAFLLPKGYVLHLHDHPHMMVCTKMLAGAISIRSFSKREASPHSPHSSPVGEGEFLGRLEFDQHKSVEDDPWYLTPKHGNFHEITALSNCVMLDILLPPYHDDNRPCTYYSASKLQQTDGTTDWILRPLPAMFQDAIELPQGITYTGYVPRSLLSPTTSVESVRSSDVELGK